MKKDLLLRITVCLVCQSVYDYKGSCVAETLLFVKGVMRAEKTQ